MAHNQVQVGCVRVLKTTDCRVTTEGTNQVDPAKLEDTVNLESITTDVVFTKDVDVELLGLRCVIITDNMAEQLVV